MARYTQEEYKLAREVNLYDFLRDNNYELRAEGSNNYAVILRDASGEHDSLKVTADGNKWVWHSRGTGGSSQVELIKELQDVNTIEAIKKLAEYAKGYVGSESKTTRNIENNAAITKETVKKEFELPEKWTDNNRVFAYLTKTRGIDPDVVNFCFDKDLIYESKKFHNAVFLGQKNEQGAVMYASLRGTYTKAEKAFKGDVNGSDKTYSFVMEGIGPRAIVYESAIDALSHASIEKMEDKDWKGTHRITLGGMSDKSLLRYLDSHPEIKQLTLYLDNDIEGKDKDGKPHNHGQIRAAVLLDKYTNLGYAADIIVPTNKDVNEDLKGLQADKKGVTEPIKTQPAGDVVTKELLPENNAPEDNASDDIMKRLEDGVKLVFTSKGFLSYLKVMSKFHRYSVNNSLLISMQRSDATMVAGYQAWKKNFERTVKKGEKGLQILAPSEYKYLNKIKELDPVTGGVVETEVEHSRRYYKPVSVFDISQTEGKELPSLTKDLTATVDEASNFISAISNVANQQNVEFVIEKINDSSKGYYSPANKKIAIKEGMSDAQTIKTAIHELAHSRMHDIDNNAAINPTGRSEKEVQAEAVAFVVSDYFKIDTSDYSFPYIASWSEGREIKELKEALNDIKKHASSIITEIKKEFNKLKEKELSISDKSNIAAIKNPDTAVELFLQEIPILYIKNEKQYLAKTKSDLIQNQNNLYITTNDLEKNKKSIPEVYDNHLLNLFKKSFDKNPIETMNIFGINYDKTALNLLSLINDIKIKNEIVSTNNIEEAVNIITDRLKNINAIKGQVQVQILDSEIEIFQKGDIFSFKKANEKFDKFNFNIYDKDVSQVINFGMYVEQKGKWKYGIYRFDVRENYAENLMDFVEKNLDKNIFLLCEKELGKNKINQKNPTKKSDREEIIR